MRIGINAHLLSGIPGYRRAGIHQYIAHVLQALPAAAPRPAYLVYTQDRETLAGSAHLQLRPSRWPTERRAVRILWEQLAWPLLARRAGVDLLHSMAFVTPVVSEIPAVVTVFDLSFMHYPESFPPLQRLYLQRQTRRSCRAARRVITISESSRQDVHRLFGVPLARIDVVTPGVGAAYRPLPAAEVAAFRQRAGLPARFVLHVGTLQPRKNIPMLLEAMAQMPGDVPLLLVGGKGWLYDEIFARVAALGLQARVHFAGYVADADLPLWYNAASLLVFPSVYEGFGLPVVEALACGTPVVAANTSSIPEAAGDAGLLVDPHDAAGLARQMTAVLQDATLAAALRAKGPRQAARFSWARAGRETAAVYRRALTQR
ncbi:MAG: glycosyltransferase family 4 protein [Anaerolineales bacterium]|nr:glycosyltransferase family 4 protein [Anaerolineales bacterium]